MSRLYVIAGPIGNLEDMTVRALRILKEEVAVIYCEDTRQTRKVVNHYGIGAPLISLHSHSSEGKIRQAVRTIQEGSIAAYLTDAGTPGVSDPGARLVREAAQQGVDVIALPGPSALTALVSVSGFNEKEIIFAGFLSKKDGRRKNELKRLAEFEGLIVVYESPHRIVKLLEAIHEVFPGHELVIGREMTKIHEEYLRGTASQILEASPPFTQKGEFTLVIRNRKSPG
jgi:16S rRNA (cytidine1402-2'-O)-methyltransferase